jgi:hypothetical protein
MPTFVKKAANVQVVQWTGDDAAWEAVRALHADSELVAFRENEGTVSIETTGGRPGARPASRLDHQGQVLVCSPSAGLTPSWRTTSRRERRRDMGDSTA